MIQHIDARLTTILGAARWAPSGDNTQPWRFEILSDLEVIIHGSDTRDWCVYDLQGHASQIAVGALLENIAIAASNQGLRVDFNLLTKSQDEQPIIRATLSPSSEIVPDPLFAWIERRVTQRRAFSWSALRPPDRAALEGSPGPGYRVVWIEGNGGKARLARLLFRNAGIRLTIREAYEVHRRIIHWDSGFSEDRIPDRALGIDRAAVVLMKWVMKSWGRVEFMNRYLAGSWLPRIEMDLVPALACAAHFLIVADRPAQAMDEWLAGGRATQRFWLTATAQGLQLQPETTPVIFSTYVRDSIQFTADQRALEKAARLRQQLCAMVGEDSLDRAVFAGRVGYGQAPRWRSLRLPLSRLLVRQSGPLSG
jgi:sulfur-carrier protein adenylyltransferase/sulfurtransferase